MDLTIHPVRRIKGRFPVPPDCELAQLAAVLSLLCPGRCTIDNWPQNKAAEALFASLRGLGAKIAVEGTAVRIEGESVSNLSSPETALDCADAATAFVLFSGLLCGRPFPSAICGMGREVSAAGVSVGEALGRMGGSVRYEGAPAARLNIVPATLRGVGTKTESVLPWAKMATLMAGLFAEGKTSVTEELPLPDDLERVLPAYGIAAEITYPQRRASRREELLQGIEVLSETEKFHKAVTVKGPLESLRPVDWVLPGDCSLAAPLIAAAVMLPRSEVVIEDVALNPTRTGFSKVLKRMGAEITMSRRRMENGVPVGDISVVGSTLKATKVPPAEIPSLIAELPLLTIVAGRAAGVTVIRGVAELKNSGMLPVGLITENLRRMGVKVAELEDGWAIEGPTEWRSAEIDSGGNAAVAMAFAIAGLLAEKQTTIQHAECVTSRFPDFQRLILSMSGR